LSNLPDYTVGGCIHVVINNQIGFTTDPRLARSSYHCTNVAKRVGAPIFHVNGDDVEAVVGVFKLAASWRQRWQRDCVVDIVCYRRHGHNSQDDPSITLPLLYSAINRHPSVVDNFRDQLVLHEKAMTMREYEDQRVQWHKEFQMESEISRKFMPNPMEWLSSNWQGEAIGSFVLGRPYNQTGVPLDTLKWIGQALTRTPDHFVLHPDIVKLLQQRKRMLETGQGVSWAMAESLAFGCLMTRSKGGPRELTGGQRVATTYVEHPIVHVRLSGQDCIRGTFNQRHTIIHCQQTNQTYCPLNNITSAYDDQAPISVCNSSLSEAAILGFEYGYSLSNENALTIWEAQFGDFANIAQCFIDNFIASGESKWNNRSSLVLLLPHGFDGQGPEHSSARMERFLQLVDDDSDSIPGNSLVSRTEMEAGFDAIVQEVTRYNNVAEALPSNEDGENGESVSKEAFIKAVERCAPDTKSSERLDLAISELLAEHEEHLHEGNITKQMW
jgi:2-oxoglutarate dehydrogenase E1 component